MVHWELISEIGEIIEDCIKAINPEIKIIGWSGKRANDEFIFTFHYVPEHT